MRSPRGPATTGFHHHRNTLMKNKKIIAAILLLMTLTTIARAGWQDEGTAAIKTADGFLLIWNQPGHYFTLKIKGNNIRPANSSDQVFFDVDSTVFQVQVANTDQF